MERKTQFSHDVIDALVATVFSWFDGHHHQHAPAETADVAFSDEWERKQIARELHWN
jgi:hypothetical protein